MNLKHFKQNHAAMIENDPTMTAKQFANTINKKAVITEDQMSEILKRFRSYYDTIDDLILLDEIIVDVLGSDGEKIISKSINLLNKGAQNVK